jgi:hypothetical protein
LAENKAVKLEISYVASDWRAYVLRYRLGTILFTAGFIFIVLFVLYVVGSRFLTGPVPDSFRLVLATFLFGMPTVSVLLNLIGVERTARKRTFRGPYVLTANERGVTYSEEHRTATFEWPAYKSGIEQEDRFIFTSETGGLLVPKRCFTSVQQIEDFRVIAKQGLNGKFRKA